MKKGGKKMKKAQIRRKIRFYFISNMMGHLQPIKLINKICRDSKVSSVEI